MMIDELLTLMAELTAAVRAYLLIKDAGCSDAALRQRLTELLEECARRNL